MSVPRAAPEQRTTPVELFWDLVFVFAVTQVSTLLYHDLSWAGLGRAMLVLALVWWAWSAFVWATNAHGPDDPPVRAVLFVAIVLTFLVALAIPGAFGDDATVFVLAYAGVRFLHLGLYADAARRGNASLAAIAGFGVTVAIGMALLVAGSQVGTSARTVLWTVAAAIDYAGPAWLTRERLRGIQQVAVAHFAERYSLFMTIGLWWTYFDHVAGEAEHRLTVHEEPVLAAADAYSYLHLLLVPGIIVFAVGAKAAVAHVGRGGVFAAQAAHPDRADPRCASRQQRRRSDPRRASPPLHDVSGRFPELVNERALARCAPRPLAHLSARAAELTYSRQMSVAGALGDDNRRGASQCP